MKRLAGLFVAVSVALILQACGRDLSPEASCNFVQNSKLQRVSWKAKSAKFYIHKSVPEVYRDAIHRAADHWNEKVGRKLISIEAVVGGDLNPNRDGYNIIYYMKKWEATRKTEQARTTIYWSGDQIYEADVRINAEDHEFSADIELGKVDMESLLVHEFGHAIGLAHVNPDHKSVMHSHLANGLDRREITTFDLKSISCEYPR